MRTPSPAELPQGDPRLLETDLARTLLASTIYARVAYNAADGTPRVLPIWFHWTGEELVFGSFSHTPKVAAIRKHPALAITIDTQDPPNPPGVLLVRGEAEVTVHDDVFDDWYAAARRYLGDETAEQWRAGYRELPFEPTRIAVRPSWVGLLDFQDRLPGVMA